MLSSSTKIEEVHRIKRPGLGRVYNGKVTIGNLYRGLVDGLIQYAPKYQRGFRPALGVDEKEYDHLFQIDNPKLDINHARAHAIAVKFLMALNAVNDKVLFNPDVIWNARTEEGLPDPDYDEDTRELTISTRLTIPDSGHRHYAYYCLGLWKNNDEEIPDEVEIERDGLSVTGDQIREWIEKFDPYGEDSEIFVEIFNLDREMEGRLFDEYNEEGKKPSNALSISMYGDKTPSRRFVTKLMTRCDIFARSEIEIQVNTIGSKSRKLTTNATLDSAIRPFGRKLHKLEEKDPSGHDNLVEFFCEFYSEFATHYPAYLPNASAKERQALRKTSFALSNIMFFPMFRLAFSLWEKYNENGTDWAKENEWRDCLSRLAGKVNSGGTKVPMMARDYAGDDDIPASVGNSAWQGKIMTEKTNSKGIKGWGLSSTRQTRDSAFHYLVEVSKAKIGEAPKA